MSYSEMIDYEAMSLKCKATCNLALTSIEKLDDLLNQINSSASTLINEKMKEYQKYLLSEKERIIKEVALITEKANEQAKLGTRRMKLGSAEEKLYHQRNDLINAATDLRNKTNDILLSKVEVLRSMVKEELANIAEEADRKIKRKSLGQININSVIMDRINNIEDLILRESTYKEAIKEENQGLSFEELLELGESNLKIKTEDLLSAHRNRIMEAIRLEMEKAKVDAKTIDNVINSSDNIQEIRENASNEIIGEEVRKESLKIILKAIESRGFIVDRKNSIKINKDKNEVNVLGKKASGQTAEFKIYLDGRFSYKFDGFEGQACQKDIEPFMNDLEEIYGLKITGRMELWKNPDKLSSQKYQTYDKNKGHN